MNSLKQRYRVLVPLVREILLHEWDPIGIGDEPEAQDEYDNYIPGVIGLLFRRADQATVARHLQHIEIVQFGLDARPKQNAVVAEKLVTTYVQLINTQEKDK